MHHGNCCLQTVAAEERDAAASANKLQHPEAEDVVFLHNAVHARR